MIDLSMTSVGDWLMIVAAGIALGLGTLFFVVAASKRRTDAADTTARGDLDRRDGGAARPPWGRRASLSVAAGLAVWIFTGWPVALPLAALAVWWWPALAGSTREHEQRVARSDAIAMWAGHLVSSVRAVSGLQQALVRSAALAPAAIAPAIRRLATRLEGGQDTREALRKCQDELNDGTGDLVCVALAMAARRSEGLADCLDEVRRVARDDAQMRREAYAERAASRTAVRIVLGSSATMVAVICLFFANYLAAYKTFFGQLVIVGIAAGYAACLWWMRRVAEIPEQPRILAAGSSHFDATTHPAKPTRMGTAERVWSSALLLPATAMIGGEANSSLPVIVICGVLIGGGAIVVVRGLWRRRPALADVIAASTGAVPRLRRWSDDDGALARVAAWSGILGESARANLRLLELPVRTYAARCSGTAVLGGMAGIVVGVSIGTPLIVAAILALVGAAAGTWGAGRALRTEAARRRDRMVHALSVWLDLVAMATRGAAGIEQATAQATEQISGDGADQIRHTLVDARNRGLSHYRGLERLAAHSQVAEFRDVAGVLELATTDGTRVRPALRDLAETLRASRRAATRAQIAAASERIWVPASLTFTWLVGLALYPALVQLTIGVA
ncbi:type II secretion system F family protein [Fodinicola acaciae]|uniref:type II secretion system F family protein n=1 Tax=Fodinicola acaciae TaxID=2681555 RepID=UPI0013D38648|nr:type II secretion system F family protein [Fodinicola acaciae]